MRGRALARVKGMVLLRELQPDDGVRGVEQGWRQDCERKAKNASYCAETWQISVITSKGAEQTGPSCVLRGRTVVGDGWDSVGPERSAGYGRMLVEEQAYLSFLQVEFLRQGLEGIAVDLVTAFL